MAAVKKPRNRLAQDLTRINLRQINRRLALLEKKVNFLLEWKRHDRTQR